MCIKISLSEVVAEAMVDLSEAAAAAAAVVTERIRTGTVAPRTMGMGMTVGMNPHRPPHIFLGHQVVLGQQVVVALGHRAQ